MDPTKDGGGADHLFGELYPQLRRLARRERFLAAGPAALQTTSLIHEAWFKLHTKRGWSDRAHFLCAAALAMRHVLIDSARSRLRRKREGAAKPVTLTESAFDEAMPDEVLIDLGEAVSRLAQLDHRLATVVDCRFFAGYSDDETAEALGLNQRTVRRDWVKAKAWLYRELTATG